MSFRHISDVAAEARKYIDERRKGIIKSCKTGYRKLDKALLGGIEWGSVISIGARPSIGKTAYSSAIIRGILKSNNISDIEILDFIWEMSGRSMIIRDISSEINMSYSEIISADDESPVTDEKMVEIERILNSYSKFPWFIQENPKSTREFKDIIQRRVKSDPYKKRIVRVDHTILAKQSADEPSQVIMLQNLLNVCVELKKQSDIIFMLLTQINRDFEDRQEDGTSNAFPRQSDVFGGDAVAQSSEVLILLNRPAKYGISYYGDRPNGKVIEVPSTIFAHIVKSRNSEPDLILEYIAQFDKMKMVEV